MQVDEAIDGMPELLPADYMDSDDESDSDESEDSGNDADSEGMEDGVQQFGSHLKAEVGTICEADSRKDV